MRKCSSGCGWRLSTGVAAIGALVMSVGAVAEISVQTRSSVTEAGGAQQASRTIMVISDQEIARGGVTGAAGAEAIVYANVFDQGNWTLGAQRFNYAAQVSTFPGNDLGFSLGIGTYIADDMFPDGGWQLGDQISSFSAFVRRSGGDDTRGVGDGTARATVTLWDGDPAVFFDTAGGGFAGAPIAGATCDFTLGEPGFGVLQNLKCNLATPITPVHDGVWMVLTSDSCRLFWSITLLTATIGDSRDLAQIGQDDDAGAIGGFTELLTATDGNCCAGGPTCGPTGDAIDCDGETSNASGRCSDGDAETHLSFNFGGPCDGNFATDSCVNYLAQINAPANAIISLVPVGGNGNIGIVGDEISYTAGGGTVSLEVRVGSWDSAGAGVLLNAYQAKVDIAGYTSALAGTLTASSRSCTTFTDCLPGGSSGADFLGACGVSGNPCSMDTDCAFFTIIPGDECTGLKCDVRFSGDLAGSEVCLPAYILKNRSDYVFKSLNEAQAIDLSSRPGVFRWASALNGSAPITAPDPFPAEGLYIASLQLDISAEAKGTFTMGLLPPGDSVLIDETTQFIPLIGVVPARITIQVGQCCDLSSQPFVCLADDFTAGECAAAGGLFDASKTCADDCGCQTDDQCADGNACTVDTCDASNTCQNTAVSVASGSCCDSTDGDDVSGGGVIVSSDDGNECTVDSCSGGGTDGRPVNDGAAADGNSCGAPEDCRFAKCDATVCVEGDVTGQTCSSNADCIELNGARGGEECLTDGTCLCISCFTDRADGCSDPKACRAPLSVNGPADCAETGSKVAFTIDLGGSSKGVTGGQFTVEFDASCLSFSSFECVAPYQFVVDSDTSNAANGSVFIACGVDPFGGAGTNGNVTMATLNFTKTGDCNSCDVCLGGVNPTETLLVSDEGQPICADTSCSAPVDECDAVTIDCPGNVSVNADCDFPTAIVNWAGPTASSDCGNVVDLVCDDARSSAGGEFPIGDTTICCTATSSTGASDDCCWTVSVADQTSLDVTVQLSPTISGDLTRCIKFELYADCVQPPMVFSRTLVFGGLFDHVGHFTDSIKTPSSGQWVCITARDQLHSLRACDSLVCSGGSYSATFKGDPFFGGNWLINGNLDGWKKDNPNASHDVIDILDFGQFVAQFGSVLAANTDCNTAGPHADINGDGVVDALDFGFVSMNFLASSKDCCCGATASLGNTLARTEVSVRELRAMGMADLTVADLNNDGVVNSDDISAFLAGDRPVRKAPVKGRVGGNVRSR